MPLECFPRKLLGFLELLKTHLCRLKTQFHIKKPCVVAFSAEMGFSPCFQILLRACKHDICHENSTKKIICLMSLEIQFDIKISISYYFSLAAFRKPETKAYAVIFYCISTDPRRPCWDISMRGIWWERL